MPCSLIISHLVELFGYIALLIANEPTEDRSASDWQKYAEVLAQACDAMPYMASPAPVPETPPFHTPQTSFRFAKNRGTSTRFKQDVAPMGSFAETPAHVEHNMSGFVDEVKIDNLLYLYVYSPFAFLYN